MALGALTVAARIQIPVHCGSLDSEPLSAPRTEAAAAAASLFLFFFFFFLVPHPLSVMNTSVKPSEAPPTPPPPPLSPLSVPLLPAPLT